MSKIPLSISLVKKGVIAPDGVLKDISMHSYPIEGVGVLYYQNSRDANAEKIINFFGDKLPRNGEIKLYTANVQAVLLVNRQIEEDELTFLVTFGLGRNLINTDCIRDKFGMRVVLNSIAAETVRSVDVNVLESVPKHDRIQLTKVSKIDAFNLNPDQDLLRAVTGRTKDELKDTLGETITGADSLKIAVDININELPSLLDIIYQRSILDVYKSNFGFIDKISPVKDIAIRTVLDDKLIRLMEERPFNLVWMSIPELVNWEDINIIRYSSNVEYYDLDVETILSDVYWDGVISIDRLKSRYLTAYNISDSKIGKWNIYRCLCAEVENGGKQYILSNGKWYSIEDNFAQAVNTFYDEVEVSSLQLEESFLNEKEGEYNKRISQLDSTRRLMMDRQLVQSAPEQDAIEFCDIYTIDKELIHVKHYTGSATLSHLFNQGFVSAELLMQRVFREKLNEKIEKIGRDSGLELSAWKLTQNERDFHHGDYKIIFAIITDSEGDRPSIPFFSKVSFRQVCQRLTNLGYHVSLMKIGINHDIDADPELTARRNNRNRRIQNRRH